jgi:hypothetical protein
MRVINWLNQNQGFVMTLLTFVYVITTAVIAVLTVRATRLNRRSIDLAQDNLTLAVKLERNRLRPYVFFNIMSSTARRMTYASIKNVGLTAAYNVTVGIKPKLAHSNEGNERESALTAHKILFLPPEQEVTDVIDSSPAFHQKYQEPIFEGIVEYEDAESNKYKEPFRIDLTFLKRRIYLHEESVASELKQLNTSLAKIANELEQQEEFRRTDEPE